MSVPMTWNPKNLVEYAKDHSIRECANKYNCSYSNMSSYLRRHKIKHCEGRPKGINNPLYKHGRNGNYCSSNCRWVTRKEQSNNKRNLHIIEYKGKTRTLTQWAKMLNIPISTLYRYLKTEGNLEKVIIKLQRRKKCVVL